MKQSTSGDIYEDYAVLKIAASSAVAAHLESGGKMTDKLRAALDNLEHALQWTMTVKQSQEKKEKE